MRQLFALFNKERRETQLTSFVLLLVGLAIPFFDPLTLTLVTNYAVDPGVFARAAICALWLNLTVLCATAFAREYENGTLDALRNTVRDWRVAAAGKFGYAFLSTLVLGAPLFVGTLIVDLVNDAPYLTSIKLAFASSTGEIFFQLGLQFLALSFVWGIFWTGRTPRQPGAILVSVACSAATGLLFRFVLSSGDANLPMKPFLIYLACVAALVLAFAPGARRFGFRQTAEKSSGESPVNTQVFDWKTFSEKKSRGEFATLVGAQFTNAAILFKSPASLLYEASLLFLICALANPTTSSNQLLLSVSLFSGKIVNSLTGLFQDANADRSLLKERLTVAPWKYWLAGLCVAATIVISYLVLFTLLTYGYYGINAFSPLRDFTPSFVVLISFAFWSASFDGSRLVKVAASFATCFIATIVPLMCVQLTNDFSDISDVHRAGVQVDVLTILVAVVALVSSYRAVTMKLQYKSSKSATYAPFVALLAMTAILIAPIFSNDKNVAVVELPMPNVSATFDPSKLPQSVQEYEASVTQMKLDVEELGLTGCLDDEDEKKLAGVQLIPIDSATPNALHNTSALVGSMWNAFELTKRGVASVALARQSERNFYKALGDGVNIPFCSQKFIDALESIPSKRPTPEEAADNAYLYYKYSDISDTGNFTDSRFLNEAREHHPDLYEKANLAFRLVYPTALRELYRSPDLNAQDAKAVKEYRARLQSGTDRFSEIFNTMLTRALEDVVVLEETRRFLTLKVAVRSQYGIAMMQIRNYRDLKNVKFQTKPSSIYSPDFTPAFSHYNETSMPAVVSKAEGELMPALDANGVQLTVPNGAKCFFTLQDYERRFYIPFSWKDPDVVFSDCEFNTYLVFNAAGKTQFSKQAKPYYLGAYDILTLRGTPAILCYSPCEEEPPFPHDDMHVAKTLDKLQEIENANGKPIVSRARVFERNFPNETPLLEGVWRIESPRAKDAPALEARTNYDLLELTNECVRYVDDTGAEILDDFGQKPKYARNRGIFEQRDGWEPGYEFAIDLPAELAKDADKLKVYAYEGIGDYREVRADAAKVSGTRVYLKYAGFGLFAKSVKELFPKSDDDYPVLIYEVNSAFQRDIF